MHKFIYRKWFAQEVSSAYLSYLFVRNIDNQLIMNQKKSEKIDIENCAVRNVLDRFGDKWSVFVLLTLDEKNDVRFNELHKLIEGISHKMLTVTLRHLEADDLIHRTIYAEIPPKVEYKLTDRGKSLLPYVHNLVKWSTENMEGIQQSRSKYEKRQER